MTQNPVGKNVESGSESPRESSLSSAVVFDVLSKRQRQYTVHYLAKHGVATLGELAEWIADRDDETSDDVERIAAGLHHGHLPKLAAAGLIDYDPETRTAESQPELSSVAPYLPTNDC